MKKKTSPDCFVSIWEIFLRSFPLKITNFTLKFKKKKNFQSCFTHKIWKYFFKIEKLRWKKNLLNLVFFFNLIPHVIKNLENISQKWPEHLFFSSLTWRKTCFNLVSLIEKIKFSWTLSFNVSDGKKTWRNFIYFTLFSTSLQMKHRIRASEQLTKQKLQQKKHFFMLSSVFAPPGLSAVGWRCLIITKYLIYYPAFIRKQFDQMQRDSFIPFDSLSDSKIFRSKFKTCSFGNN